MEQQLASQRWAMLTNPHVGRLHHTPFTGADVMQHSFDLDTFLKRRLSKRGMEQCQDRFERCFDNALTD